MSSISVKDAEWQTEEELTNNALFSLFKPIENYRGGNFSAYTEVRAVSQADYSSPNRSEVEVSGIYLSGTSSTKSSFRPLATSSPMESFEMNSSFGEDIDADYGCTAFDLPTIVKQDPSSSPSLYSAVYSAAAEEKPPLNGIVNPSVAKGRNEMFVKLNCIQDPTVGNTHCLRYRTFQKNFNSVRRQDLFPNFEEPNPGLCCNFNESCNLGARSMSMELPSITDSLGCWRNTDIIQMNSQDSEVKDSSSLKESVDNSGDYLIATLPFDDQRPGPSSAITGILKRQSIEDLEHLSFEDEDSKRKRTKRLKTRKTLDKLRSGQKQSRVYLSDSSNDDDVIPSKRLKFQFEDVHMKLADGGVSSS